MPIPSPNLDDRNFADLVESARQLILQKSPDWTDLSPGDPGIVLVELFAYLTDVMLYRLNRVPDKAYHEFLRMIGVRLQPPSAAVATLRFTAAAGGKGEVDIPQGTRVGAARAGAGGDAPVFVTAAAATIPAGGAPAEVTAYHCDLVEGELVGLGTGRPGLWLALARPPLIAPTGDGLDLVLGVEAAAGELDEKTAARRFNGKDYRIWRSVDHFSDPGPDPYVFIADRLEGMITFAPAARLADPAAAGLAAEAVALAAVPETGREIRAWYRRGGGPAGNLPADSLTLLKDPIAGVTVTNPAAATGGRAAESLDNALIRGPQELHSLNRAVTARDYELNAVGVGSIARARALTRAALWTFASPGMVEVALVPDVPSEQRPGGWVAADAVAAQQTEPARAQVQAILDERRPLGTTCLVSWAHYKSVKVRARLHVRREEDAASVSRRVIAGLYDTINPLPTPTNSGGWQFGQPLRASDVYYIAQREPGVSWVDQVTMEVGDVPDTGVTSLVADPHQADLWYAAAAGGVFSSRNGGRGWELTGAFPNEQAASVAAHRDRAGFVAVSTRLADESSRIHVSYDCGQTWQAGVPSMAFPVNDIEWTTRDGTPMLLMATDKGLYELSLDGKTGPVQVLVDVKNAGRPLYAVAAAVVRGVECVAVAAQSLGGVYFSRTGGRTNTYRMIGLDKEDVRVLRVQLDGPRGILWAGVAVEGTTDPGRGCFTWELGAQDPPELWVPRQKGFEAAGSCRALAFQGEGAFAATHHGGVLRLPNRADDAVWQPADVNSGLPLRDPGRFHPVDAVEADAPTGVLMAGGVAGVVLSTDGGATYRPSSRRQFTTEDVTIPATYLMCSNEHELEVVTE